MPACCLIYVTCPDNACAKTLATALVDERLAACVQIFPRIRSVYRWQGRVHQAGEVPVLVKTSAKRCAAAVRRIAALHPYDVPGIVMLPVNQGHPAFLRWIQQETTAPRRTKP